MSKVSKVVLGNDTIMDITDSTVTENNLLDGEVAYGSDGERVVGRAVIPTVNDGVLTIQKNGTTVQTFSANQSTDVTANITVPTTAADVGAIPTTQKGVASGVAELDSTGKVPSSQLPSYVDDTIEGYLYNGHWYSDAEHTQEVVGETGKIYVELSTNKTYRWSGTTFVEISESLALGETSSTAYRGDRGATAYSHATDANKVSSATATGLYKVGATAEGHISELQAVQKSDITNLGIPGAVKLTITVSESEDPQTGDEVLVADKTPSEVLAALNSGMVVEAVYEGGIASILTNDLSTGGTILFGFTAGTNNVGMFHQEIFFTKDSQNDAWESIELIRAEALENLNASISYSNNTYSCDYTYDEFEDARSNGQEILVEYDDSIYYFTKYDSSEYTYYFSSTLADSDGTTTNTFVMVGDDSTGDWDSITLTESSGGSASSFLVRVYEDPQTQQTTCDKLPSEILAAYTNGSIIQAKIELEGEDAMLDLASCMLSSSPYLVIFSTLVTRRDNDTVTLSLHLQKNSSSDTWEDIDIYQSDLCHYVGNISHDTNGYYFDITPSKFDDAISYSLGARIKYVDSDNDVTYDFYLSRYDTSDSEHTVFYLTSVNADSTGETTILTFALYPDWELDDWDNIVLYETNGSGDIIWTGTQAEYEAQASQIPVGAYVNITDDEQIIPYASAIRWEEAKTSVKKNLLKNELVSDTTHGVTFIKNSDGSITVYGTATNGIDKRIATYSKSDFQKALGGIGVSCKLSGCPSGGSLSTYFIRINGNPWLAVGDDIGNGCDFTVPEAISQTEFVVNLSIKSGVNMGTSSNPMIFQPMIRLASVQDDTYEPFIYDNVELNDKKVDWTEQNILGAKNLLPNNATSRVVNGTTFTVASDGSISISGAPSSVIGKGTYDIYKGTLQAGKYIISSGATFSGGADLYYAIGTGSATSVSTTPNFEIASGGQDIEVWVYIPQGVDLSSKVVYPMIRLASDTDTTYQPYAKTNRELTKCTQNIDYYEQKGFVGKNILKLNGSRNINGTSNGVTFTYNDDTGIVTANGTPTASVFRTLANYVRFNKDTTVRLAGCPTGGNNKYYLGLYDGTNYVAIDYGYGAQATVSRNKIYSVFFNILSDASALSNIQIKPILSEDLSVTYDKFVPYFPESNRVVSLRNLDILGSKNLMPNYGFSQYTINGITFTKNSDGSILINGTNSKDDWSTKYILGIFKLSPGLYCVSQGPTTGSSRTNFIRLKNGHGNGSTILELGDNDKAIFRLDSDTDVYADIQIRPSAVISNAIMYPMIRIHDVESDTFVEFAKTNQELTEDIGRIYNELGGKNLLPVTDIPTVTSNGITYTVNSDGSISLSGTATATEMRVISTITLEPGTYRLSGIPYNINGGYSKIQIHTEDVSTGTSLNWASRGTDGSAEIKTLDTTTTFKAYLDIYSGYNVTGITVYPMIRLASVEDSTFVPYAQTNRQLTKDKVDWKTNSILGAKNLLNLKNHTSVTTSGNITYTIKSDGSVSVGASTANANAYFPNDNLDTKASLYYSLIPNTKYIASFGVTLDSTTYIQVYKKLSTDADWTWVSSTNSGTSLEFTTDSNASYIYWIRLCYISSKSVSATTLYPMIRLASDTDSTYQPYAMTNRQLTELAPVWTSSVSALTGATSVTITNPSIHTTSVIEPFADNGTNTAMSMPTMTVTEGQCVLGFDALTADTTFKLRITN